jgi:tRNA threonylcarbamoyladenosine biosynthesis protein TsaB
MSGRSVAGNILAIDTVTDVCSIAVSSDGEIYQITEKGQKNHSRKILGMVSEALKRFGLESGDIDNIVVDTGPGSFTGVRIGLGIAQGLAYAHGIKVYEVCSLEVLAQSAGQGLVLPAIDARMGQVYCGLYDVSTGKCPELCSDVMVVDPSNVPIPQNKPYTAIGNGWTAYDTEMKSVMGDGLFVMEGGGVPEARYGIEIVAHRATASAKNATGLSAFYVRNQVAEKRATRLAKIS